MGGDLTASIICGISLLLATTFVASKNLAYLEDFRGLIVGDHDNFNKANKIQFNRLALSCYALGNLKKYLESC